MNAWLNWVAPAANIYCLCEANPYVLCWHDAAETNSDGSVDVYFGPKAPAGLERNWVQTLPGKGWNMLFRLYGPLDPWFDKTWKLSEIERLD